MEKKILPERSSRDYFARLLFVILVIIGIIIYGLLLFGKASIKVGYLGNWFLYLVIVLLLWSLIVLLRPLFLGIKRIFEKRREAKRLRLKFEKKKEKEGKKPNIFARLFKRKIKEEKKKEIKQKKPSIFLRLFKKKAKEEKKEEVKQKKPGIFSRLFKRKVKEEKKEEIKKEKQKPKEKIPLVKELPRSLKIGLGKYETDLDVLYKIVEQKGRIKLFTIAKYFGVDKKQAEEWATILEDHELIKIHYPAIGGPELRKWKK